MAPEPEPAPYDTPALALGRAHSCALVHGDVWCWGDNRFGQLGDGTTTSRLRPVRVLLPKRAARIASGDDHVCATLVDPDGETLPHCWGKNDRGQLAGAGGPTVTPPLPANDASGYTADRVVPVAGANTTCFEGHEEYGAGFRCWGEYAMVAFPDIPPCRKGVPCTTWFEQVATRNAHRCALHHGYGPALTLSCSAAIARETETENVPLEPVRVAVGRDSACAVLENGDVSCWGDGTHGELGVPLRGRRPRAAIVPGIHLVTALCMGEHFACALATPRPVGSTSERAFTCWGSFGDHPVKSTSQSAPRVNGAIAIGCGTRHACVATSDGGVTCWGANESSQLGDGTTRDRWEMALDMTTTPLDLPPKR